MYMCAIWRGRHVCHGSSVEVGTTWGSQFYSYLCVGPGIELSCQDGTTNPFTSCTISLILILIFSRPAVYTYKIYKNTLEWSSLMDNLLGSRLTMKTTLWVCLWGIFLTRLTDGGSCTVCGQHHPWIGVQDCRKRRNRAELFPASWPRLYVTSCFIISCCHDLPAPR